MGEEKIRRLQDHLALIRACAGWSAADLGNRLGVTRQMVSNLENGHNRMTRMQYLAIRQVLADEIADAQDDDARLLKDVLCVLVDRPEEFTAEQRNQVLSDANLIAPSIVSKKTTRKNASAKWVAVLAGVIVGTVIAAVHFSEKNR